ncbi:MAG TPA: hypothetical protein DCG72_13735, partial [Gammaproteobacteria bacterium]|nr:hypothetical protein [Gammaproteobacteria bacterium]
SAQAFKNLGYEGIIDNKVSLKFGAGRQYGTGMEGVDYDTQHIITFPGHEGRIRSKFSQFDPDSTDLSALTPKGMTPQGGKIK